MNILPTRCVIAGGGPAGMMVGFLLARAGVEVVVLEKHKDFNRDFRGDTIHPSTLELMFELGLLEEFLKLPHQELRELKAVVNGHVVPIADFSHLPTKCKFIAFMPQWDFLNFLAKEATRLPSFRLLMETEVTDVITTGSRITGVHARSADAELQVHADLVIAADGRHSRLRAAANLDVIESGVPIDVLWMRISKRADDPEQSLGFFRSGRLLVLIDRGDYWQCGYVIPKGAFEDLKSRGLNNFHGAIVEMSPFLADRVKELNDWGQIKVLAVQINRLRQWCRDGLLCIGDAAHAMSPAGGVGINLAIQDAVAAANLLAKSLQRGAVPLSELRKVQQRREWPTRLIQLVQTFVHRRIATGRSRGTSSHLPLLARLLRNFPLVRRIPARLVGLGLQPEHIAKLGS